MKKQEFKFIFAAYGIFWIFLSVIGLALFFGMPQKCVKIASTISSWSPTLALLLVFDKLNTGYDSRRSFIKSRFQGKAWVKTTLFLFLIQTAIFFIASCLICCISKISCNNLFRLSPVTFVVSFISTALGGALGEEFGWRGYLFWEQSKEYGIINGAIFNGIVWTLWHIPLWIIRGGTKWELLIYIIAFSVTAICASVIMGVFYNKTKNLMTSIGLHFSLNFWVCFVSPEVPAYIILSSMSVFYILLAIFSIAYQCRCNRRLSLHSDD